MVPETILDRGGDQPQKEILSDHPPAPRLKGATQHRRTCTERRCGVRAARSEFAELGQATSQTTHPRSQRLRG